MVCITIRKAKIGFTKASQVSESSRGSYIEVLATLYYYYYSTLKSFVLLSIKNIVLEELNFTCNSVTLVSIQWYKQFKLSNYKKVYAKVLPKIFKYDYFKSCLMEPFSTAVNLWSLFICYDIRWNKTSFYDVVFDCRIV